MFGKNYPLFVFENVKKLEDFECEKVEINTIYGGTAPADAQTWCAVRGQVGNDYDGVD
ncbi:hypothetical protein ACM55F_14305 [Flavobacterium sp. XS2P12]|uniref:hypothetical protein n=1 Tax=Flavobacterium melibiosi TaxID=3398734 RepID=UPI003A8B9F49